MALRCLLIGILLLTCSAVFAKDRTPDQAERMYQNVGDQLFCICGCREKLLVCSHNVCTSKTNERKFLHELCKNPKLDEAGIKAQMVQRFGKGVLQLPEKSSLYPVLIVVGVVVVLAFGAGFWVVTRHDKTEEAPAPDPSEDNAELEARIERELKELDQ